MKIVARCQVQFDLAIVFSLRTIKCNTEFKFFFNFVSSCSITCINNFFCNDKNIINFWFEVNFPAFYGEMRNRKIG